MPRDIVSYPKQNTRKIQVLLVGGVIGALTGVGAAYLLWQARDKRSPENEEATPVLSSGNMVKIGVLLFGLLRQIGEIARGE